MTGEVRSVSSNFISISTSTFSFINENKTKVYTTLRCSLHYITLTTVWYVLFTFRYQFIFSFVSFHFISFDIRFVKGEQKQNRKTTLVYFLTPVIVQCGDAHILYIVYFVYLYIWLEMVLHYIRIIHTYDTHYSSIIHQHIYGPYDYFLAIPAMITGTYGIALVFLFLYIAAGIGLLSFAIASR